MEFVVPKHKFTEIATEIALELLTYGGTRSLNCPLTGTLFKPKKNSQLVSLVGDTAATDIYYKAFGYYYILCQKGKSEKYVLVLDKNKNKLIEIAE